MGLKRAAGQGINEMSEQLKGNGKSRLYAGRATYPEAAAAIREEAIQNSLAQSAEMLELLKTRGRVDLDNLEEVAFTANRYMESCKKAGIYPNMLGFSAACGVSRATLYRALAEKSGPAAQYLEALRTQWAAILLQLGLTKVTSEAMSIFLLKNSAQGFSDNGTTEIARPHDEQQELDLNAKKIMEKYRDLP